MSLLSWNCRGLGHPRTVRELHSWVKDKKPDLVFLIETKLRNTRMQVIRRKLNFSGMLTVDPVGKSGGLALLWRDPAEVDIINFSARHICARVSLSGLEEPWKFTGFYGSPDCGARADSWLILRHLQSYSPQDWLCMGDFNEILDLSEKKGGRSRNLSQMDSFLSALVDCNLGDLGFKGSKYTWRNKRESDSFIKERLDRALANPGWCSKFPEVEVHVLPVCTSDHNPLWVCGPLDEECSEKSFF